MFSKKRSKPKAKSDDSLVSEALADLLHDQEDKAKRKRRRGRFNLPGWADNRILIGLGLVVVAIISDGIWRENQEFAAKVTAVGGDVWVSPDDSESPRILKLNDKVVDYNIVRTGPTGWAQLTFPDGSVMALDSNTTLKVKLLEYNRGGAWRSRNFMVLAGRIFARVGENFGKDSKMNVYTPACVAAVRGTRFSVAVEPDGKTVHTVCNDGTVEVRGFNGRSAYVRNGADTTARPGQTPAVPVTAPATELYAFRHASMNTIIRTDPWYIQMGLTVTQTLDAPLTILGIGKCSWAVGAADFARRSRAMEAMRLIRANLEGDTTYPYWVNPATLEELGIKEPGAVRRILQSFDGAALETYWSDGQRYYISARARDRKRTRYELQMSIISEAKNQN